MGQLLPEGPADQAFLVLMESIEGRCQVSEAGSDYGVACNTWRISSQWVLQITENLAS